MVLNLGCTLEPILCEVWKYWYPCRNPGQLKQNSGKKPFLLYYFSLVFFFFFKVLQVILICSQNWEPLFGQFWLSTGLETTYIPSRTVSFHLLCYPESTLCLLLSVTLFLILLFRKRKGKKILLVAISKEISIIKPQMSATLIWNSHWNSVI